MTDDQKKSSRAKKLTPKVDQPEGTEDSMSQSKSAKPLNPLEALQQSAKRAPKSLKKTGTSGSASSKTPEKKLTRRAMKEAQEREASEGKSDEPERERRVVNVVSTPQLSTSVPTAPKRVKPQYASFRSSRKSLVNPRRVRGGAKLKLKAGETPQSWVTQRLLRLAESGGTENDVYKDGIEYARLGQTKRLTIEETLCEGIIQGRSDKPYTTTIALEEFSVDSQEKIIAVMADQVRYTAKLLAGELPSNIEDVFAPLGLRLFPSDPNDVKPECSCPDWKEDEPWCKHAVCLTSLLAERLGDEPMLIFGLRGMPGRELIDGLRQRRAVGTQGPGPAPVLHQHIPGVSDSSSPPLEDSIESFWEIGDGIADLDTPIMSPQVNCVLLRRLGPSPFVGSPFPLIGLMATCYQLISESTIRAEESFISLDEDDLAE